MLVETPHCLSGDHGILFCCGYGSPSLLKMHVLTSQALDGHLLGESKMRFKSDVAMVLDPQPLPKSSLKPSIITETTKNALKMRRENDLSSSGHFIKALSPTTKSNWSRMVSMLEYTTQENCFSLVFFPVNSSNNYYLLFHRLSCGRIRFLLNLVPARITCCWTWWNSFN